jgi:hypothetical protein
LSKLNHLFRLLENLWKVNTQIRIVILIWKLELLDMVKRMVRNKIDNLIFDNWKSNKGVKWPLIGMCNIAMGRSLQSLIFFLCDSKFICESYEPKICAVHNFTKLWFFHFGNFKKFSHFNAILITNHIIYHKRRKWWLLPSPSHNESCECVLFITSCSCINYLVF